MELNSKDMISKNHFIPQINMFKTKESPSQSPWGSKQKPNQQTFSKPSEIDIVKNDLDIFKNQVIEGSKKDTQ